MCLLDENPIIPMRGITSKASICNDGGFYFVIAFVNKGFVRLKKFTKSKTKACYIYELTSRCIRTKEALAFSFLESKKHEYEDVGGELSGWKVNWALVRRSSPAIQETPYELW